MNIPVLPIGQFVVCFEALAEDCSMRHHFVNQCGWTPQQFAKIRHQAWFAAKVSIWKDGVELASDYLGCCAYKSPKEFYVRYRNDYFSDMVLNCAESIADRVLLADVKAWRLSLSKLQVSSPRSSKVTP